MVKTLSNSVKLMKTESGNCNDYSVIVMYVKFKVYNSKNMTYHLYISCK